MLTWSRADGKAPVTRVTKEMSGSHLSMSQQFFSADTEDSRVLQGSQISKIRRPGHN